MDKNIVHRISDDISKHIQLVKTDLNKKKCRCVCMFKVNVTIESTNNNKKKNSDENLKMNIIRI